MKALHHVSCERKHFCGAEVAWVVLFIQQVKGLWFECRSSWIHVEVSLSKTLFQHDSTLLSAATQGFPYVMHFIMLGRNPVTR